MHTRVYATCVDAFDNKDLFSKCYNLMDVERKAKIDEKVFPKDKKLSLGVGMLLHIALAQKKFVDTYFNLSHSGNMALCIVSDKEVGCDIELKRNDCLKIADRFFFNEEKALIDSLPSEDEKREMFFRLWTLKESFMKATRLGFELPLDEFCILPDALGGAVIKQHVNNDDYTFYEYGNFADYACSICIRAATIEKPKLEIIDFSNAIESL